MQDYINQCQSDGWHFAAANLQNIYKGLLMEDICRHCHLQIEHIVVFPAWKEVFEQPCDITTCFQLQEHRNLLGRLDKYKAGRDTAALQVCMLQEELAKSRERARKWKTSCIELSTRTCAQVGRHYGICHWLVK